VRECEDLLVALVRGETLSDSEAAHVAACERCAPLAPGLRAAAGPLVAGAASELPGGLTERVLRAAAPLLAEHARAAGRASWVGGRRLVAALAPAVLAFPLLVLADVLLLRAVHALLATLLPAPLTTYLVASYAALLAALVCLTFGAIPLLVQRQAYPPWKEGHV
jgi:hypothetical protein